MSILIAQPANDNCAGAIEVLLGVDSASAVRVDMDTRGATQSTTPASVCSGSFFADDVWALINTGDVPPQYGIVVKAEFTGIGDDVPAVGMAVYRSCNMDETPLACFSSSVPEDHSIVIGPNCLEPNEDYYIRIWSGAAATDFSGTFRAIAYPNEPFVDPDEEVYYFEDFNDGMDGWTVGNFEGVDSGKTWLWDEDGTFFNGFGGTITMFSDEGGCTPVVGLPGTWLQGNQTNNVDSLPPGPPYPKLDAWLESPDIDLTQAGEIVSVTFDQFFRGLNGDVLTGLGAILIWSADGGKSWSWDGAGGVYIDVNPEGEEYEINLTYNNDKKRFTIPGIGGVPNARIAFVFEGDFYDWIIDNVRVIKVENNNLAIDQVGTAIAPQARTPLSQVEPQYFRASVSNNGGIAQPNTRVSVEVRNIAKELMHSEEVNVGTVAPVTSGIIADFKNSFTPPQLTDTYTVEYFVQSDSVDFDISDNDFTYRFDITTMQFAKIVDNTGGWTPGAGFYDAGIPHSWTWGNVYHVPNDLDLDSCVMEFALSNNGPGAVTGPLSLTLYEWNDDNGDFIVQGSERNLVAFAEYAMTGTEAGEAIRVPLLDFITLENNITLEGGTTYLAMLDYIAAADEMILFVVGDTEIDFTGMVEKTIEEGMPRFAGVIGIPTDGNTQGIDYVVYDPGATQRDLGLDIAPHVNLDLFYLTSTIELSDNNKLDLYPNPASDVLNVKMELEEQFSLINLNILDVQGRTISREAYFNVQNGVKTLDISSLNSGSYLLQLVTDKGFKTTRFVVQK